MLADFFIHSRPVVLYLHASHVPGYIHIGPDNEPGFRNPCTLHSLCGVGQDIQDHLLNFAGLTRHGRQVVIIFPGNLNLLEVIFSFQVVISSCKFNGIVQDFVKMMYGYGRVFFSGKTEHIIHNLRHSLSRGGDSINHPLYAPVFHESFNGLHGNTDGFRRLFVGRDVGTGRKPLCHDLGGLHHSGKGIIDFVGHARGKPSDREHLLALDHNLFHAFSFGDILKGTLYQNHPPVFHDWVACGSHPLTNFLGRYEFKNQIVGGALFNQFFKGAFNFFPVFAMVKAKAFFNIQLLI